MTVTDVFDTWCTEYSVTHEELLAEGTGVWRDRLINRGLLIIKGLPPTLTDAEFHAVGSKFGQLWTSEEYIKASVGDPTLNKDIQSPVSYFKTKNTRWKDNDMKYHADMAHIGAKSLPFRALYMVRSANNGSGDTYWLNAEVAYEQFTEVEKQYYKNVDIYQHFMYRPGTNITKFPFLKTNPYSGKVSPRVNCYGPEHTWIHHVDRNGMKVEKMMAFMENLYRLCESKKDTFYKHHWSNGDILVYDNWNGVHRRDPITFDPGEPDRLLKRLTFN